MDHISVTRIARHPPLCARGGDWLEMCQRVLPTQAVEEMGRAQLRQGRKPSYIQRPHMPRGSLPTNGQAEVREDYEEEGEG